jgi:uncharacterized protein (DUF736 family)
MAGQFEAKPDTGVLFKNEKKDSPKHPDYKGNMLLGGQEYWLSAWINEVRSGERAGEKYMSIKFNLKEEGPSSGGTTSSSVGDPF